VDRDLLLKSEPRQSVLTGYDKMMKLPSALRKINTGSVIPSTNQLLHTAHPALAPCIRAARNRAGPSPAQVDGKDYHRWLICEPGLPSIVWKQDRAGKDARRADRMPRCQRSGSITQAGPQSCRSDASAGVIPAETTHGKCTSHANA
jgi:hypothetical protein